MQKPTYKSYAKFHTHLLLTVLYLIKTQIKNQWLHVTANCVILTKTAMKEVVKSMWTNVEK